VRLSLKARLIAQIETRSLDVKWPVARLYDDRWGCGVVAHCQEQPAATTRAATQALPST
jgi:hypothetical protein